MTRFERVEINRVQIEILNWLSHRSYCLQSKHRERQANIFRKEEDIISEAECHIQSPIPSINAGATPTLQHRGWWRPMGAASHRPHARISGSGTCMPANATQAIGPNALPTERSAGNTAGYKAMSSTTSRIGSHRSPVGTSRASSPPDLSPWHGNHAQDGAVMSAPEIL